MDNDLHLSDYDSTEYTYADIDSNTMLMPNLLVCEKCNYKMDPKMGKRCKNNKCTECGHRVKVDGYPKHNYTDTEYTDFVVSKNKEESKSKNNTIEHMDGSSYSSTSYISSNLVYGLILLCCILVFCPKLVKHTETNDDGDTTKTSYYVCAIICIILFPHLFIPFLIVASTVYGINNLTLFSNTNTENNDADS